MLPAVSGAHSTTSAVTTPAATTPAADLIVVMSQDNGCKVATFPQEIKEMRIQFEEKALLVPDVPVTHFSTITASRREIEVLRGQSEVIAL